MRLIGNQAIGLARYSYRLVDTLRYDNESEAQKIKRFALGKIGEYLRNAGEEVPLPLSNLVTGVVLPDADTNILLDAAESDRQSMENFISSRIQSSEINFWDPVQKLKIKSFSSVAKKIAVKNQKDMMVSVSADRELFGCFLVTAKNRDINLKKTFPKNLSTGI